MVRLPEGLIRIGNYAFDDCYNFCSCNKFNDISLPTLKNRAEREVKGGRKAK